MSYSSSHSLRAGISGIESRWEGNFPHPSTLALGPTKPPINGYQVSFLGVQKPARGVDQPPSSSAEVKQRAELYLYSSSGPSWPVIK